MNNSSCILLISSTEFVVSGIMGWAMFVTLSMGVILLFRGKKRLELSRRIEDIPTSRIRSCSLGLAEIKGKAISRVKLRSPLTRISCVYYYANALVWGKYQKRPKTFRSEEMFFLKDDSGTVIVMSGFSPKHLRIDKKMTVNNDEASETFIREGDQLYILGRMEPFDTSYTEIIRNELSEGRRIDTDKVVYEYFDSQFGSKGISPDRPDVRKKLNKVRRFTEYCKKATREERERVLKLESQCSRIIVKEPEYDLFIVTDRKENEICGQFGRAVLKHIYSGAALILFSLGYSFYLFPVIAVFLFSFAAICVLLMCFSKTVGTDFFRSLKSKIPAVLRPESEDFFYYFRKVVFLLSVDTVLGLFLYTTISEKSVMGTLYFSVFFIGLNGTVITQVWDDLYE